MTGYLTDSMPPKTVVFRCAWYSDPKNNLGRFVAHYVPGAFVERYASNEVGSIVNRGGFQMGSMVCGLWYGMVW